MGAGRRTETYLGPHPPTSGPSSPSFSSSFTGQFLNLPAGELASVIFGCTHATFDECVTQLLFGLPQIHFSYIKYIQPGMPLFLFNYSDRKLHGIFEADGCGDLNINPYAWTGGRGKTQYSAQVRVRVRRMCSPLPERVFKEAIEANYLKNPQSHFYFELNHVQTDMLLSLFTRNTATINNSYITSQAGPTSRPQGEDEDGWCKPKKTTKAVMDAWHNAAPFIPPSAQSTVAQGDKRAATPEHWYDQENTGDGTVSENTFNKGHASEDPLHQGSKPTLEKSLDWRVNVFSSDVVSNEGLDDQRKTEREREVMEKLKQLKGKGKQVIGEVKAEALQAYEKSNGDASGSGSFEPSEVADSAIVEWERLARERCLQEQTMLREEREQLKEKLQALDAPVARAISKNLELSASAIAQMRQDEIKLRHLMDEAMSQTELLRELDQLRKKNATLEYTQVRMASELEGLKSDMSRMSLQFKDLLEHIGQGNHVPQQPDPLPSSESKGTEFGAVTRGESWQQIYLIGGHDSTSWLDCVDVLYPATYEITSAAPMSTPRSYAAACVLMGSVYVFGGGDGSLWFDTVEMYNQERDEWTLCSPMSQKKGSLAGATIGDRIYAVGGGIGKVYFSEVECYDAHLGTWIGSTSMLSKRFGVAATELNGALYAIGGYNEHYLASAERFDPREALWTAVAPMARRRGSLSAVALEGKIYAIGGYDGAQFLNAVEYYEPRRNCWIEMDMGMQTGRAYGAVARADKDLYMFGGLNGAGYIDTVECYREGSDSWWIADDVALGRRCFLACAVLE